MSEIDTKIARARMALVILLEQAVSELGDQLVTLGTAIRSEDKDVEDRAKAFFTGEAKNQWGTISNGEAEQLYEALQLFDKIVKATAAGPHTWQIYWNESRYWEGERDHTKLERLRGVPAIVRRHLAKAGLTITGEHINGYQVHLHVSRPA